MLVTAKNKDTANNNKSNSYPPINPLLNFTVIIVPAISIEKKVEINLVPSPKIIKIPPISSRIATG
ncbi:hypothetical protein IIO_04896 [Bacillus cereus VD115]|nr:hypothetical protein IIO_04896 [Bacillus cereus VD115]